MGAFITRMIMKQRDISLEAGQAKYKAYFVNTTMYTKWHEEVNTLLTEKGCSDCIVTE